MGMSMCSWLPGSSSQSQMAKANCVHIVILHSFTTHACCIQLPLTGLLGSSAFALAFPGLNMRQFSCISHILSSPSTLCENLPGTSVLDWLSQDSTPCTSILHDRADEVWDVNKRLQGDLATLPWSRHPCSYRTQHFFAPYSHRARSRYSPSKEDTSTFV